ncbi:MAG: hypothetical protein JSS55_15965 [Proteobacteria bacterium]|nr:hypothetical protein [Pseudomonadota bacterium]
MLEALARAAFEHDVTAIDSRSTGSWGWRFVEASYPFLDVVFGEGSAKPIRLRMDCTDWPEIPPSITLLEVDGSQLGTVPQNSGSVYNQGPFPGTSRPFVCMRGVREYHTLHSPDLWDNYRGQPGMDLGGILFQLWRVWKRGLQ